MSEHPDDVDALIADMQQLDQPREPLADVTNKPEPISDFAAELIADHLRLRAAQDMQRAADSAAALIANMRRLRTKQVMFVTKPWSPKDMHPAVNPMTRDGGWKMEKSLYRETLKKCDDELARAVSTEAQAKLLKQTPTVNAAAEVLRAQRELAFVRAAITDFMLAVEAVPDGTHDRIARQLRDMTGQLRAIRERQIRPEALEVSA